MCMIAYRPVKPGKGGANIPHSVIALAMNRHPDGFGIAWREMTAEGPVLRSEKFGPSGRKAFKRTLKRVDNERVEYVAHFRFATQGPKQQAWAHPYEYEDPDPTVGKVLVFHNGIIDIEATAIESDTQVFVRDVLAHLPTRWWTNPALRYLVNEAIGWSKIVLMTAHETVNLHETTGTWDAGVWYSSSHKAYEGKAYVSTGTYTGGKPGAIGQYGYYDKDGKYVGFPMEDAPRKTARDSAIAFWGREAIDLQTGRALSPIALLAAGKPSDAEMEAESDFEMEQDWEKFRDGYLAKSGGATRGWWSGGHPCTPLSDIRRGVDGDFPGALECDVCKTIGDLYIIDGKEWIDMGHMSSEGGYIRATELEEDEAGLLEGSEVVIRLAGDSRRARRKAERKLRQKALVN